MRTLMYADTPFTRQKVVLALDETVVKSTVSQSCKQDCLDFAERMKRKALRVRSEGSIPPYVTEAESRKQHSDSPLCNSHITTKGSSLTREVRTFFTFVGQQKQKI